MVAVGVTVTLVPRTAPTCGDTIRYPALLTLQFNVTDCPALIDADDAVKLAIVGADPCGTFDAV